MRIDTPITLDLAQTQMQFVSVGAKQGDNIARHVLVKLMYNGEPYTLDSGVTAVFRVLKLDGNMVADTATILEDRQTVDISLSSQALALRGEANCDIMFTKESGEILSCPIFKLLVTGAPLGTAAESKNASTFFNEMMEDNALFNTKLDKPEEEGTANQVLTRGADGKNHWKTGGTGGTTDYTKLNNKPQINGHELTGNKTGTQLGIVAEVLAALPTWNGGGSY